MPIPETGTIFKGVTNPKKEADKLREEAKLILHNKMGLPDSIMSG